VAKVQIVKERSHQEERQSHVYDALRNTWIYQDIEQFAREELEQQVVEEYRVMLLQIIQGRFPSLEALTQQIIPTLIGRSSWQTLIVEISIVRTTKEARILLSALK